MSTGLFERKTSNLKNAAMKRQPCFSPLFLGEQHRVRRRLNTQAGQDHARLRGLRAGMPTPMRCASGVHTVPQVNHYQLGFNSGYGAKAAKYSAGYASRGASPMRTRDSSPPHDRASSPPTMRQHIIDPFEESVRRAYSSKLNTGGPPPPLPHRLMPERPSMSDLWRRTDHIVGEGGDAAPVTASPFSSLVGGVGLTRAVAGFPARLTLVARSHLGQPVRTGDAPWVVSISGPGRAEVAITDHQDGSYTIRYLTASSGRYKLAIRLGEHHLSGSPFEVGVRPAPSSLSLSLASADRALSLAAQSRHTVRGLFARWRAYVPLERFGGSRLRGLFIAAIEHEQTRSLMRSWRVLVENTERLLARRRLLRAQLLHVLGTRATHSLGSWRTTTYGLMGIELTLFLARRALAPHEMRAALRVWSERIADGSLRPARRGPRRLLLALFDSQRASRAAFTSWRSAAYEENYHLRRRAIAAFVHSGQAAALRTWLEVVRVRVLKRHVLRQMLGLRLARAWRQLVDAHAQVRDALALLESHARTMLHGQTARGFRSWCESVQARARALARLRQGMSALRDRAVLLVWNAWSAFALVQAKALHSLRTAVGRFRNANCSRAWNAWAEMATERAGHMSHLRGAAARLMHRQTGAALRRWQEAWELTVRLRRGLKRLVHRELAIAFDTWSYAAGQLASSMAMLAHSMARLINGQLALGWHTWSVFAALRAKTLAAMSKCSVKILNLRLAVGWHVWVQFAALHAHSLETLRMCGVKLFNQRLALGWTSWAEYAAARKSAIGMLHMCSRRLINRRRVLGWNSWVDYVETRAAKMEQLRRMVSRMTSRERAAAWNSWKAYVSESTEAMRLLRGGVGALIKRELAAALRCWRICGDEIAVGQRAARQLLGTKQAQALRTWHATASAASATMQQLRRCVSHMRNRKLALGFLSWLQGAQLSNADRLCARIVMREQTSALLGWRAQADERATMLWQLRIAVGRWSKGQVVACLERWAEEARHAAAKHVVIVRMMRQVHARALRQWREVAEGHSAALAAIHRAVGRLLHRLSLSAINTWRAYVHELNASLASLRHSICSLFGRFLRVGWNTWRDYVEVRAERLERLGKAASQLQHAGLAKAFRSILHAAQHDATGRAVLNRMLNSAMTRSLMTWRSATEAHVAGLSVVQRVMGSWLHRAMSGALRAWKEVGESMLGLRRAVARLVHKQLQAGWEPWSHHTRQMKRWRSWVARWSSASVLRALLTWMQYAEDAAEHAQTLAAQLIVIKQCIGLQKARAWRQLTSVVAARLSALALLRGAALKLIRRQIAISWRSWAEMTTSMAAKLGRLEQSVATLRRGARGHKMAMAWRTWAEDMLARNASLTAVQQVICRLYNGALFRGWHTWVEVATERAATAATKRKVAMRLIARSLSSGFATWVEMATEHATQLARLVRGIARLRNRDLSQAWHAWSENSLTGVAALAKLRHCVGIMFNRRLYAGWLRWHHTSTRRRAALKQLGRCARMLLNKGVPIGWHMWLEFALERHAALAQLGQCLARFLNLKLARGWHTWCEAAAQLASQRVQMRRSLMRLIARSLSSGFATWVEVATERAVTAATKRKVAMRLLKRGVSMCWLTWKETSAAREQAFGQLRHAGGRLFHRRLALGWATWKTFTSIRADMLATLVKSGRRLFKRGLALGWTSWAEYAAARQRAIGMLHKCSRRLINRRRVLGWNSWVDYVETRAAKMYELRRSVSRMLHAKRAAAWNSWKAYVSESAEAMRLLRGGVAGFRSRELATALRCWLEFRGEIAICARAARQLLWMQHARALRTWQEKAYAMSMTMGRLRRCVSHIRNRKLAMGFLSWVQGAQMSMAQRMGSQMLMREQARALRQWQDVVHARRAAFTTLDHCFRLMRGYKRAKGLRTWQQYVRSRRAALQSLRHSVSHMRRRRLSRGWSQWKEGARLNKFGALSAQQARRKRRVVLAAALAVWRQVTHEEVLALREEERQRMQEAKVTADDAAARDSRVAALMQQNSALRASTLSMSAYVERCAAQVASVAELEDGQHVAVSWYVTFLEDRVSEMRRQLALAAAAISNNDPTAAEAAQAAFHEAAAGGPPAQLPRGAPSPPAAFRQAAERWAEQTLGKVPQPGTMRLETPRGQSAVASAPGGGDGVEGLAARISAYQATKDAPAPAAPAPSGTPQWLQQEYMRAQRLAQEWGSYTNQAGVPPMPRAGVTTVTRPQVLPPAPPAPPAPPPQQKHPARVPVRVVQAFDRFDADHSGFIDRAELHEALHHYGIDLSGPGTAAVLALYDDTPDGQMDLSEFAELVRDLDEGMLRSSQNAAAVAAAAAKLRESELAARRRREAELHARTIQRAAEQQHERHAERQLALQAERARAQEQSVHMLKQEAEREMRHSEAVEAQWKHVHALARSASASVLPKRANVFLSEGDRRSASPKRASSPKAVRLHDAAVAAAMKRVDWLHQARSQRLEAEAAKAPPPLPWKPTGKATSARAFDPRERGSK